MSADASTNGSAPGAPLGAPELLARQREAFKKAGPPSYEERLRHLDRLESALISKKRDLCAAVNADFGQRPEHITELVDLGPTLMSIRHARAHLHEWMEPELRDLTWLAMPARGEVAPQPLGVIGIISPWNYPLQLAFEPLVDALAAGNRAILKPSELVPKTADAIQQLVADTFPSDQVTVVTGGADVGEAFAGLPFDHLVFTGSPRVGKLVMKAAAENLVPVTLELGGKSPALVGERFPLAKAAERLVFGKLLNAGQTCVAPDYVLVPRAKLGELLDQLKQQVSKMYPNVLTSADYTAIVNDKHFARLEGYLAEAKAKGARVEPLQAREHDRAKRLFVPTAIVDPSPELSVMQEEIFGPILPLVPYDSLDQAIAFVNDRPRPLALYVFDHDDGRVQRVLRETVSGGVTVNDTILHAGAAELPFGGVGNSGMGCYHGKDGFDAFSKRRPVYYQARINGVSFVNPPYKDRLAKVLKYGFRTGG